MHVLHVLVDTLFSLTRSKVQNWSKELNRRSNEYVCSFVLQDKNADHGDRSKKKPIW